MAEKRFSELTTAGAMTGAELLAMSQETLGTLLSVKSTLQNIANWFAVNSQYASALDTTDKTLCGAINELKQLISLIPQFSIEVVQTLPTEDISETTIYLVPNSAPEQGNYYEEYIYVNNTWELVGTTAVDLSAYYTKLEVDGLLAAKANTSDVTAALALKEAKADLDDDVTDIVVGLTDEQTTAPGNPVTLTTEQSGGAKSALVTFAPKQSGTGDPSPTNIRPISGWDSLVLNVSENLFSDFVQGGINDTTGADVAISTRIRSGYKKCPKSSFALTLNNAQNSNERIRSVYFYTENNAYISSESIENTSATITTIPSNAEYIRVVLKFVSDPAITPQNETVGVNQLTNTAAFPDTVYGGEYDFVSGKCLTEYSLVTYNGTENWNLITDTPHVFYISISGNYQNEITVICDKYKGVANGSSGSVNNNEIRRNRNMNNILVRDDRASTVEEFKALCAAENINVAYFRNTPTKITLTPADVNLLKGSNTIWTDGDTVQIKYSELPQGNLGAVIDYIKKLEARVKALES